MTRTLRFARRIRGREAALCMLALAVTALPGEAQERDGACPLCDDGPALIERFGLREARDPVRERAGWGPPMRIVIDPYAGEMVEAVRMMAPGAEVIALTDRSETLDAIRGADIYVGGCSSAVIDAGTDLKWIQLPWVGAERCAGNPDVAARDILVTNGQRLSGPQIADHVIAFMLSFARGLPRYAAQQAEGGWSRGQSVYWEVEGKTVLVVGLGGIGTEVAKRANGLGMRVLATRNSRREGPEFVEYVGLAHEAQELAARADVVVNTTPLTDDTRGMFNATFFDAMRPSAYFISVGRGASTVTDDLVAALESGSIAGAGLDVTDPEPLPRGHPLWSMPNVLLTPHSAADSDLQARRIRVLFVENLRRYVAGERMLSVVDLARGY